MEQDNAQRVIVIMKICLFAAGNYNVGDNALLHSWLCIFNRFLGSKDIVYILGIESSYVGQYADRYNFRIITTNSLYRLFIGCADEESMKEKLNILLEEPSYDRFAYEEYQIHQIFSDVDLLHIIGGGIINDMWLDMQYLFIASIEFAKRYNVRVIMTGQTLGPFKEEDKARLLPYFKQVDLLDLRDDCSWLRKEGIDYQVTVDDVFAYLKAVDDFPVIPKPLMHLEGKRFISVCLQSWNLQEKQIEKYAQARNAIAEFIDDILTRDSLMHVCFLEFMHLDHDYDVNCQVFNRLSEGVKNRCYFITCSNFWPFDVARFVGQAEFCVTTRLHLSIFSMLAGVSVYSIVLDPYYKKKFEGIYDAFDVHQTFEISQCSVESLKKLYLSKKKVSVMNPALDSVRRKYKGVFIEYWKANKKLDLLYRLKLKGLLQKI